MPTGVIIIFAHLHKAQRAVVVGPHPLHGINDPSLHRGVNLTSCYSDCRPSRRIEHFASEAGDSHFQSLEILPALETGVEPAGHLDPGTTSRKRHHTKWRVELSPKLQPPTIVEPAVSLLRRHAKWHSGIKNRRGDLPFPVVGRPVTGLGHTARYGVKNLKSGYDFAGTKYLDL